jgi:glucose/arabinose dehydrogenase
MAFPPGGTEGADHFYVDYTRAEDGATVVARYGIDPEDQDRALPGSFEEVLTVPQPFGNHNGGMTAFGPDGYLYIALGDGGGSGDPGGNGQDPSSLLGSILRIDVESSRRPYAVPADNPFVGREGYREEIWAWGLRNPWRFSFDRRTGDLYIADVGQRLWEEIDFQHAGSPGGENYGWNRTEGSHCYDADTCDMSDLTAPVHEYGHDAGCSVTGGYVYRGTGSPGLFGVYLFGDYCSGRIWGLSRSSGAWTATELADTELSIVSFGESASGEIYVVDIGGEIYRLVERQPSASP